MAHPKSFSSESTVVNSHAKASNMRGSEKKLGVCCFFLFCCLVKNKKLFLYIDRPVFGGFRIVMDLLVVPINDPFCAFRILWPLWTFVAS